MITEINTCDVFGHSICIREAFQTDIDDYAWPTGTIEMISIEGDVVERLLPPPCLLLSCPHIGLRSLEVPDGVEMLTCSDNFLTELVLPPSIRMVEAGNNLLTHIRARDSNVGLPHLHTLKVGGRNRIRVLDFAVPPYLSDIELAAHDDFTEEWKTAIRLGHAENMPVDAEENDPTDEPGTFSYLPEQTPEEIHALFASLDEEFKKRIANRCTHCGHFPKA